MAKRVAMKFSSVFLSKQNIAVVLRQQRSVHMSATFKRNFLQDSQNCALDKSILWRYKGLVKHIKGPIQATYLWIDGTQENMRSKCRILEKPVESVEELPRWLYDGSSTDQATPEDSDVTLMPRAIYRDPFRPNSENIIVLCDTYNANGDPTKSNSRCACMQVMDEVKDSEPWFGIEQEYMLLDTNKKPFGFPSSGAPAPKGPYYCGVGADRAFARDVVDAHCIACLYAGIKYYGNNAEVTPSQWEYQIGPCPGITAGDDLWASRYILHRIAEEFGLVVSLDPKPVPDWNGSGGHINFSTKEMREDGGLKVIEEAIEKLGKKHAEHVKAYDLRGGKDNARRLTGEFETSNLEKFSSGVAARNASVRLPRNVYDDGKGFLEDRRPSSNVDPYVATRLICQTCLIDEQED